MNIKIYNNDLPSDLDLSGEKIVALDNEALGLVLGRDPLTPVSYTHLTLPTTPYV